ncbi:hypothetical protein [Streptomyces sp. NPDC046939]|uniref:hypothetical protein n=1 Tax=Streptomyces sp. NPDC046939 TaxID=3155376 RepID=UPI0033D961E5
MRCTRTLTLSAVAAAAAVALAAPVASAAAEPHEHVRHGRDSDDLDGARRPEATPADMAIGGALVASGLIGGGALCLRRRSEGRA